MRWWIVLSTQAPRTASCVPNDTRPFIPADGCGRCLWPMPSGRGATRERLGLDRVRHEQSNPPSWTWPVCESDACGGVALLLLRIAARPSGGALDVADCRAGPTELPTIFGHPWQ